MPWNQDNKNKSAGMKKTLRGNNVSTCVVSTQDWKRLNHSLAQMPDHILMADTSEALQIRCLFLGTAQPRVRQKGEALTPHITYTLQLVDGGSTPPTQQEWEYRKEQAGAETLPSGTPIMLEVSFLQGFSQCQILGKKQNRLFPWLPKNRKKGVIPRAGALGEGSRNQCTYHVWALPKMTNRKGKWMKQGRQGIRSPSAKALQERARMNAQAMA